MKIALAQLNFTIADIDGNTRKIIQSIEEAKQAQADLIVFSELAVCAYPPDDLLDYPHFIESCKEAVHKIAEYAKGIIVIVGSPMENPEETGRRLYNSACVLEDGVIKNTVYKTLLPTYDVFNESRYFEVNELFNLIDIKGVKCAVTICEDLWHEMDRFDYQDNPLHSLAAHNPDLIINLSASPFNIGKRSERYKVLQSQAKNYKLPMVYVNQTGVHSDLLFDGNSLVLDANGDIILELPIFEESIQYFDTDKTYSEKKFVDNEGIDVLHKALVYGIKDFFFKTGFKKAILGSSGGIDSAVVQALASAAIGSENVTAVMMPSQFSSTGSVDDAVQLSKNLGNPYHILPIENIYKSFESTLSGVFKDLSFNIAEENIQARSRAVLLMAMSNKFGDILLNTSNKSEMSVGYTTLYGDMCGSLSVMGDVYKTAVYQLAEYINKDKEIIPKEIIYKAPSAELRPDQKDSDSLPEYSVLDAILFQYIDNQLGPEQIISQGFNAELVNRIITMVNRNEYKRFQAPPILRVSGKAFGRGRVIPLVSRW